MKKYFILCFFTLFSCNEIGVPSDDELPNLKKEVLDKGNYYSYMLLEVYCDENNKIEELIPYTILMITKHKNKKLYSSLFQDYMFLFSDKGQTKAINKFDSTHKSYLINILLEGSKNKDLGCLSYLDTIYRYGYFKRKDIKKADSIRLVIDKELNAK